MYLSTKFICLIKLKLPTLFLAVGIFAFQSTSILEVSVRDVNNGIIPKKTITLKNGNGYSKMVKSNSLTNVNFLGLKTGKYQLEIQAEGFKPYLGEIEIKSGENKTEIMLEIAEFVENVESEKDIQETATETAFSNFLSKEEIDGLPDEPEEIERELKNRFGQDAIIRVDGFPGQMPPKSQIASIKVTRSSFDAEFHQIGATVIDVTTKAGAGKWSGSASYNFNDSTFNARHPFASQRFPSRRQIYNFFLSGPIIKNKSSLFASVSGGSFYNDNNIVAALPDGELRDSVRYSSSSVNPWIKFTQNLSANHFLGITYQGRVSNSENNGTGGFNLLERAFAAKNSNHQLRFSEVGNIGKRFYNEFRLQYTKENSQTVPNSDKTAIIVLDSFNNGGAGNRRKSNKQGVWIADNFLFGLGKIHAMKIGGLFEYESRKTDSNVNQNGTFTFSSLNDFILGRPATFTQSPETRKVNLSQVQAGTYVQDDVRLHRSFLLSLGLRYEWQNNLSDYNNFSPRIGFSWSPNKRGKITFRGGAGVYYNWFDTNSLATVLSQDAVQPGETIIINPSYPDPFSSGSNQFLPKSYWQKADNQKNPYIFLTSIGIEYRLNNTTSVRALYKYEKGVHQFRSRDINAPINGTRPNQNFGRIVQVESSAFFQRSSLNLGLNGRFSKQLSYSLDYTLAKNNSDADGIFSLPSDNYNLRADRSASNLDQRHRIYGAIFWRIRKGLNFSTNLIVNSPLPYSITTGRDNNADTVFNDRPFGTERNSERGAWQKQVDMSLGWTFGLVKRKDGGGIPGTIVVTPGEASSGDIGISPNHKYSIKLFVTANNVFNFTNFNSYVGTQTSPLFRQPVSANNARRIEFGARFSF